MLTPVLLPRQLWHLRERVGTACVKVERPQLLLEAHAGLDIGAVGLQRTRIWVLITVAMIRNIQGQARLQPQAPTPLHARRGRRGQRGRQRIPLCFRDEVDRATQAKCEARLFVVPDVCLLLQLQGIWEVIRILRALRTVVIVTDLLLQSLEFRRQIDLIATGPRCAFARGACRGDALLQLRLLLLLFSLLIVIEHGAHHCARA
mmetsp:Transcript_130195/g.278217  ORF Transcript_130195/g.278217 Transcript_130195/m.278217 type:complete len:204 (-) Transcript_130195:97-708(-)